MKVIIAGGRNYKFKQSDILLLKCFHYKYKFTEIVSGGATGADAEGEAFAENNNIMIRKYIANWGAYKRAAGPIRNGQMAQYADAVILFPGGDGTASMRKLSKEHGLKILYDAGE